jgi:hypothetical protein
MAGKTPKQASNSLLTTNQELEETTRLLRATEVTMLSDVARALADAAESLSRTAKDLADQRSAEWMTPEQAAGHLGCRSVQAFEKVAAREGIPRHYISARSARYNRAELDAWLMGRQGTDRS